MSNYSKFQFDLVTVNNVQFECYYLVDSENIAELFHAEIDGNDLFDMLNIATIAMIESKIYSMLSE